MDGVDEGRRQGESLTLTHRIKNYLTLDTYAPLSHLRTPEGWGAGGMMMEGCGCMDGTSNGWIK
jgi:hypothetical protein